MNYLDLIFCKKWEEKQRLKSWQYDYHKHDLLGFWRINFGYSKSGRFMSRFSENWLKLCFLYWRFYGVATIWCKKDFYNPFYLLNHPFESIFQKIWPEILIIVKDLDKPTQWQVHLHLFPPSVIRGPCLIQYSLMKINFRKPSHKSSWFWISKIDTPKP